MKIEYQHINIHSAFIATDQFFQYFLLFLFSFQEKYVLKVMYVI